MLKTRKGTLLRHQKRQIDGLSTNRLLDVWETLLSFRKYVLSEIVSEYDQEKPQSQTADNPVAPRGRAAQPP